MTPEVVGMRKFVVSEVLSLDGVAEDPDKFLTDWDDDVMDANLSAVIDTQDAAILGRRSYDEWAQFWPASTISRYMQRSSTRSRSTL
jgi:dihydrofolate reductase